MRPVIYIDILFILNFFINSILLYSTAAAVKKDLGVIRLVISAAVSALYSCAVFFPSLTLAYTVISKIIFSVLLIMLSFKTIKPKEIIKILAVFYIITFSFGGAVFALIFFTNTGRVLGAVVSNGSLYLNLPVGILLIGVVCAYLGIMIFTKICIKNFSKQKIILDLKISISGNFTNLRALIDTGSSLVEPISHKPVIVAEYELLSKILPNDITNLYAKNKEQEFELLLKIMDENKSKYKFCLIPYGALGMQSGIILGIIPDYVEILNDDYTAKKCVVGLYNKKLSDDNEYNALINPDALEQN